MTTLFTTTLETALTGTNGFSSVGANPTLDTASTIKGAQCARWTAATSGVGTLQPASDQNAVYFSLYFKANSYPAAPRFMRAVDSAGVTSINLVINSTSTPSVKLRNGTTTIGTSATQLTAGTIYRIGVKIVKNSGVGVADGVAELFIAVGDTAFGAAAAASSAQVLDNPIDKIEVGPTNGVAIDAWMDDLIWSDSAMPAASGGGAYPAAPSGLTATVASATSVNLLWVDNATNETAYTVERATNPAGPWTVLTSTLPANTTTYTATSLTTSTTYYFRVKATNASGSSAYSATASATPISIGAWNWTEIAWPYRERYQPIILAATAGVGYIALTQADPTDPTATYTYYSGPLVGETLTAVADETAARAAAVALPSSGRWMLPSVLEARAVRLWHRNTAAYTVREFYPFRVVEADQVSAQFIRGMYISGHQLVVDQLSALSANLGTVTAGTFRTAESGARTVMTSDLYGGLVSYDPDDNYDTTTGAGSYQILLSKTDGKLYAGGGNVVISASGLAIKSPGVTPGDSSTIRFLDSAGAAYVTILAADTGSTRQGAIQVANNADTDSEFYLTVLGAGSQQAGVYVSTVGAGGSVRLYNEGATFALLTGTEFRVVSGGVCVGSATGAAAGEIKASGKIYTTAVVAQSDAGDGTATTVPGQLGIVGATNPNLLGLIGLDTTTKQLYIQALESGVAWTNVILVNNGGNVGIGSTSPTEKLAVSGNVNISGVYKNAGTQVVGTRKTGWGTPTGTATRTAFATGSVTTAQLAERVKALIDDLTSHGLIGV